MKVSVPEKLEQIKTLARRVDVEELHSVAMTVPLNQIDDFDDLIARGETTAPKGMLVGCDGIIYIVVQDTTLREHYRPSSAGMLALFQPHQGNGVHDWLYGEYSTIGTQRYDNGVLYEAIQNPNANIHSPSQVPAVWKVVETETI